MSIKIIKAGILDTIQDRGRYGYQQEGINPTGAMDVFSMQVANMLVGNDPGNPVIELHFPASVFMFEEPVLIALSGADFSPTINGEPVPILHPIMVTKNDLLQFQKPLTGARAYISVAGEMLIEKWLGSHSTNMKAKAGGYHGRSFTKDDEIFWSTKDAQRAQRFPEVLKQFKLLNWQADTNWEHHEEVNKKLFVIKGNEWDQLDQESQELFRTSLFNVSNHSDRMGLRLRNLELKRTTSEELLSTAVSFGTIQLLPNGEMIILAADHQTTGGYPRIAHVISAHHSKLAQLKAGDIIHYEFVEIRKAEELLYRQHQHLIQIKNACTFKLNEYFEY